MDLIWLHSLIAVLSAFRLTLLFTKDAIWKPVRDRFPMVPWWCELCMSVWAGIGATVALTLLPWLNWPFALSWLYLANKPQQKEVPQMVDTKFQAVVNEDSLIINSLLNRCRDLAAALETANAKIVELSPKPDVPSK